MKWTTAAGRTLPPVVLALLCAGVLMWKGVIDDVAAALRTAGWRWILIAAPLAWLSLEVHGLRWWLLVRRSRAVPFRAVMHTLYAASAAGLVLPLRAGAVLQLQVLHGRYGIGRTALAGTLAAEAVLDAVVLPLLAIPVVLALGWAPVVSWGLAVGSGCGLAVLAAMLLAPACRGATLRRPLFVRAPARVRRVAADLGEGFAAMRGARSLLGMLVLTAGAWLLSALAYGVMGAAMGLDVPPLAFLAVEIMANLSGAVALTQGNVGSYELAVSGALVAFGARPDEAAVFAVAAHASTIIGTMALGVASAAALRLGRADLRAPRVPHAA